MPCPRRRVQRAGLSGSPHWAEGGVTVRLSPPELPWGDRPAERGVNGVTGVIGPAERGVNGAAADGVDGAVGGGAGAAACGATGGGKGAVAAGTDGTEV